MNLIKESSFYINSNEEKEMDFELNHDIFNVVLTISIKYEKCKPCISHYFYCCKKHSCISFIKQKIYKKFTIIIEDKNFNKVFSFDLFSNIGFKMIDLVPGEYFIKILHNQKVILISQIILKSFNGVTNLNFELY